MRRGTTRVRRLAFALLCLAIAAPAATAQRAAWDLRGYALGLATAFDDSPYAEGGAEQLARVRWMADVVSGALTLDAAWEHVVVRVPPDAGGLGLVPGAVGGTGTDWLDLGGTVHRGERTTWTHRLDRLSATWEGAVASLTVGRQTISWATTLFLTPADPFSPFDPSDPFREYRGGVDAVRVRVFPGPFTELELVARGAGTPAGDRATVLARGQSSRGGWAFGAWGGWSHERPSGALFTSGALGSSGVRAEASFVEREGSTGITARVAAGIDRRVAWWSRDAYLVAELQYDGLGASSPSGILEVVGSPPFRRGELQVLSSWTSMVQASVQVHPLVAVDALALTSLADGSLLLAPGLSWSATRAASVRVGGYLGLGNGNVDASGPASEYGTVPNVLYASLSWFF